MQQGLKNMETSTINVLEEGKDFESFIDEKIEERKFEKSEDPFFVGNLDKIFEKYQQWQALLPRVTPFYAVKCNNTLSVLQMLSALGAGFDCASKNEMEMVLSIGVKADKIIFAHTTKPQSHIKYACEQGVGLMTFDSEEELLKISTVHPRAKLVLRIAVDDSKSQMTFNKKFGATLGSVERLLKRAQELHLNVIGVSFHVGSLCTDSVAYKRAIADARHVFDQANLLGFQFDLLDIGGGFTGSGFQMMSKTIKEALNELFPADSGVKVIAEPGRYFVDSAFTLAINVFAKKRISSHPFSQEDCNGLDTQIMYYVTDGVFGSFGDLLLYPDIKPFALRPHRPVESREPTYPSVIWGPCCDSADKIIDVQMPELDIGDWILVDNIGAYSITVASNFNGFAKANMYLIVTAQICEMLNLKM